MSLLHDFIETGKNIERIRELLMGGEYADSPDNLRRTPLYAAVMKIEKNPQDVDEILAIINELINCGANVNHENPLGFTPLHLAALCRNCKTMKVLLEKGAAINSRNNQGWTALHYLVTRTCFERTNAHVIRYDTDIEAVKLILSYDPDVNIPNASGNTPLMLAVKNKDVGIVHELLNKNASVNLQDQAGETVMHYVLSNVEVNELMLLKLTQNGGSFHTLSSLEKSPMDYYCEKLLQHHTRDILSNSIIVFRLFKLQNKFNTYQNDCLEDITIDFNNEFLQLLAACDRERKKMRRDRLVEGYTVYNIAVAGAFRATPHRFPDEVLRKMMKRLMKNKYYMYCDLLLYGIYDEYMRRKFVETFDGKYLNNTLMNRDELCSMSINMKNLEMFKMMKDSHVERANSRNFPRFQKCSIS